MISVIRNSYDTGGPIGHLSLEQVHSLVSLRARVEDLPLRWDPILPFWAQQVKTLRDMRSSGDADGYKRLKPNLPAYIFAAKMRTRREPEELSGWYSVDIDWKGSNAAHFERYGVAGVRDRVMELLPSAATAFASPSNAGVKVVHALRITGESYEDFDEMKSFFRRTVFSAFFDAYRAIGIELDEDCKDFNRICYFSYDRGAPLRLDAVPISIRHEVPERPDPAVAAAAMQRRMEWAERNGREVRTYRLDGRKSRCPFCGQDRRFRAYVDALTGQPIGDAGWCDRVNSCKAHKKPWDADPSINWVREIKRP